MIGTSTPEPGAGRTALVIGGTGPTGSDVVAGLAERGYETTIFHSGRHEIDLPAQVRHIHGDAHFPETIKESLGDREFDVVVAQYGRLRWLAEHFVDRTEHMVAIGGAMGPLAAAGDERWGPLGRPPLVREEERHMRTEIADDKLGYRIAETARAFLELGQQGAFKATYIAYPVLYGPRQPGSPEWAIVRRLRDGRRRIILPDGGRRLESRAFVRNVSQAPLLALTQPDLADGKSYVVTDRNIYTVRQRVEAIAAVMGVDVEIVSLPYELATPAHALYRRGPEHRVSLGEAIRAELGYEDRFEAADALRQTVDWLLAADADEIAEIEFQLGDPFDYAHEDALADWWHRVAAEAPRSGGQEFQYSHMYRHPMRQGDDWLPADRRYIG
jgi:nucleoside-diphosphate-sugar epimerase